MKHAVTDGLMEQLHYAFHLCTQYKECIIFKLDF